MPFATLRADFALIFTRLVRRVLILIEVTRTTPRACYTRPVSRVTLSDVTSPLEVSYQDPQVARRMPLFVGLGGVSQTVASVNWPKESTVTTYAAATFPRR